MLKDGLLLQGKTSSHEQTTLSQNTKKYAVFELMRSQQKQIDGLHDLVKNCIPRHSNGRV